MKHLTSFDWWILERVEKISHKIQRLTGHNCFSQARLIAALVSVLWIATIAVYERLIHITSPTFAVVFHTGNMLFTLLAFWANLRIIQRIENKIGLNTMNEERIDAEKTFERVAFASLCSVCMPFIAMIFGWLALVPLLLFSSKTVGEYLKMCTPLPPCDGKIKKFFQSLSFGKAVPEGV